MLVNLSQKNVFIFILQLLPITYDFFLESYLIICVDINFVISFIKSVFQKRALNSITFGIAIAYDIS